MKNKKLFLAFAFGLIGHVASADTQLTGILAYFPEATQKKVFVIPKPVLSLNLLHLEVNDENWDELQANLSWDPSADLTTGLAQLKNMYPDYEVNLPPVSNKGTFHIEVPSIGYQADAMPSVDQSGPWIRWPIDVSKKNSTVIENHFSNDPNLVLLTGSVVATFERDTAINHATLPHSICQKVIDSPTTLFNVMKSYVSVSQMIDKMQTLPTTRETLKRSVLENCVSLPKSISAKSFSELLNVNVTPSSSDADPYGETRGLAMTDTDVNLNYSLNWEKL